MWFVGSRKKSDRSLVEEAGITFYPITTGKLRRYLAWENVLDFGRFVVGCVQAYFLIGRLKPDVVLAKGGYVTLPVIMAAGWRRIPVVVCESDAILGLSTRLGWRYVGRVATAYPAEVVAKNIPRLGSAKLVFTGLPIDTDWQADKASKPFANSRPTVVITGGSQGAQFLNQVVAGVVEGLLPVCNVVHYTGRLSYSTIAGMYESIDSEYRDNLIVRDFDVDDFRSYIKSADLVITRAGSSALEMTAIGKPMILIPLPNSASNHQEANAQFLANLGAAVYLKQDKKLAERLVAEVERLVADKQALAQMKLAMQEFGSVHGQAADKIAALVIATANK